MSPARTRRVYGTEGPAPTRRQGRALALVVATAIEASPGRFHQAFGVHDPDPCGYGEPACLAAWTVAVVVAGAEGARDCRVATRGMTDRTRHAEDEARWAA